MPDDAADLPGQAVRPRRTERAERDAQADQGLELRRQASRALLDRERRLQRATRPVQRIADACGQRLADLVARLGQLPPAARFHPFAAAPAGRAGDFPQTVPDDATARHERRGRRGAWHEVPRSQPPRAVSLSPAVSPMAPRPMATVPWPSAAAGPADESGAPPPHDATASQRPYVLPGHATPGEAGLVASAVDGRRTGPRSETGPTAWRLDAPAERAPRSNGPSSGVATAHALLEALLRPTENAAPSSSALALGAPTHDAQRNRSPRTAPPGDALRAALAQLGSFETAGASAARPLAGFAAGDASSRARASRTAGTPLAPRAASRLVAAGGPQPRPADADAAAAAAAGALPPAPPPFDDRDDSLAGLTQALIDQAWLRGVDLR